MPVRILSPGFMTTVQDMGRLGYAHLGVSPAGAADRISFRIANRLVGNREGAPVLEMTLVGASLEFEEAAVIAAALWHIEQSGKGPNGSTATQAPSRWKMQGRREQLDRTP